MSLADFKGTLEFFFRELFGPGTAVRFRPHFFPFTEPSFEIDVKSAALKGGTNGWKSPVAAWSIRRCSRR